ncbi:TetR/AcrR family transcriptional regulator [Cohnella cholangitidis]|uniref:TetR/AcrR family transcriptional regulator n=1 Tax=Cohnella cholangitidis TaxID=2598458 RepID=A0A7G5C6E9_9BACL|nr:TetR/AcrR family transcriptional regulator [Cohnella cholangitidis]QMV44783.1 TetR/AcrR family transcriptional regulator [Cohnella cholangitidis]
MKTGRQNTGERLLQAAINLISERGYNGVTTEEIATSAGLSEKTLFRYFGTKLNLLESSFDHFNYAEEMKKVFQDSLVWELEADLFTICKAYHDIMNRDRKLVMISLREAALLPHFKKRMHQHPLQLLEVLTQYFVEMGERGKMVRTDPEMQAFTFMMTHFGAFINDLDSGKHYPKISLEPFMKESVRIFARALTP